MRAAGIMVALAACHSSTARPPSTTPTGGVASAVRRTHENLNAVLWMQTAAEYAALTRQTYVLARARLDAALNDSTWTAAIEQTNDASSLPAAVVVDLDETILDNSAFQARQVADSTPFKAVPYSEDAWNRWCEERKAVGIPGAVEFLTYARSRGVTPIYVTNRDHKVEQATRDVLQKIGAPLDPARDTVLTRHENGWDASDKSARRQFVAATYRILLLVGDNFEDFAPGTRGSVADRAALAQKYEGYWGTKWIVLPNPTYGSWESAIASGQAQLLDSEVLKAKYAALRVARD